MRETGGNERLNFLISRYEQKIFALALYLASGDRDKAFDAAASSLAEALRFSAASEEPDRLLPSAAALIVEKCRALQTIPRLDDWDFDDAPAAERRLLNIVRQALQSLAFDQRVAVLLRDQLNLPYQDIAAAMGLSEKEVRGRAVEARAELRKRIEAVLRHGR